MKIITQAQIPDELARDWLQHLRDFDVAHPGCHFEVTMTTDRSVSVREMVEIMRVEPALSMVEILDRKRDEH